MSFALEKSSNKLLILLLFADLLFMLIHVLYSKHLLVTNFLLSIETDQGYAEVYQYIKEYWIVLLLCLLAIKMSQVIYFAWSTLFLYLLLDDSLEIHESLGKQLVDYYGLQSAFSLRAQDFGEIFVSIFFGLLLFSFIGITYLLSDFTAKKISKQLFILVIFVAFFGIVVDTIHVIAPWKTTLSLIEDGGEMLLMSIIFWYVFNLKMIPNRVSRQKK